MNMENNIKHIVRVPNIFSYIIEVDAPDKQEALKKTEKLLQSDEIKAEHQLFYETTFAPEHWSVLTVQEIEKLREGVEQKDEISKES